MLDPPVMFVAAAVVQTAPAEAPLTVRAGDITVSSGGAIVWTTGGAFTGDMTARIENAGAEPDRIISINAPVGTVSLIRIYPVVDGRQSYYATDDLVVAVGTIGVLVRLADFPAGQPAPPTITIVFERAGEVTVRTVPVLPAPPPAVRRRQGK